MKNLHLSPNQPILLFDGVCNLCNGFVQTLIRLDQKEQLLFASLQSDAGKSLLKKYQIPSDQMDTVVLIKDDMAFTHADVAIQVAYYLGGIWKLPAGIAALFPVATRNQIYSWIARNRYRWFGKKQECMIPTPELKARFL